VKGRGTPHPPRPALSLRCSPAPEAGRPRHMSPRLFVLKVPLSEVVAMQCRQPQPRGHRRDQAASAGQGGAAERRVWTFPPPSTPGCRRVAPHGPRGGHQEVHPASGGENVGMVRCLDTTCIAGHVHRTRSSGQHISGVGLLAQRFDQLMPLARLNFAGEELHHYVASLQFRGTGRRSRASLAG
jgi:hypothetical protein